MHGRLALQGRLTAGTFRPQAEAGVTRAMADGRRRSTRTGLLAALVLAAGPAFALDPGRLVSQYGRDVWTTVQGLPQSSVISIGQTADGYMWLGTNGGLVRFDGASFTVYEPDETPGLVGHQITALRGGPDGSLWIGTDGKGITRYRDGVFRTLGPGQELTGASGNSIYVDSSSVAWVGTWWGLLRHGGGHSDWLQGAAGRSPIFAVAGDGAGGVIATSTDGVVRARDGRLQLEGPALRIREGQALLVDRTGVTWVGSMAGLDRIENGQRRRLTTADGLLANFVTALLEDRDGGLWIGTEGGLNRWYRGRMEGIDSSDGLPADAITSLFEDREGNVWAGLRGVGLVRFRDSEVTTYARRDGLVDANVTCVFQSSDGSLWFGTTKGLTRWKDGRSTAFTRREGLANDSVTALGEDPELGVLVGTYAWQVNTIRGDRVGVVAGLDLGAAASAFRRDREGSLWVGTLGSGAFRRRAGRFERFPFDEADGRYVVYGIGEDRRGAVWFGTANGLVRHEAGRFSVVEAYRRDGNQGVAFEIHEAPDGSLWAPTRDRGVCRLREDGPARCYGRAAGLPDETVYTALEDDQGRLYLGTPKGIAVVARGDFDAVDAGRAARLRVRTLGVEDGMATAETQGLRSPAGFRSRDGRLWFASVRGAVAVDPARIGAPPAPPPLRIESVGVDGKAFDAAAAVSAPPGRGGIEVRYAGLSFRAPRAIRFRYRLDGFDPDWIEAGGRRVARYTNIPPGEYTFRVTAAQGDGPWNEREGVVAIALAPHFYETRWWHGLLALAATGLVWAGVRWRVRALRRHTVELQEKVAEAVANVKVLNGLLPICSGCKRIRSDEGYWHQIEAYIRERTDADFTHGMCPDCMRQYFPEVADRVLARLRDDPAPGSGASPASGGEPRREGDPAAESGPRKG